MPKDVDEIVVAGNGQIYVAPLGSTPPTNIATAWGGAWIDLGYASEDGVTINKARNMDEVRVWQSFFAARRYVTSEDFTVSFNLAQWNADTVSLAFGGGEVTPSGGIYTYTPPDPGVVDERMLGVEWVDGEKTYRLLVARVMVTDAVETQLSRTGMAELPITLGLLGEEEVNPFTIITDDPAWAAAS